MYTTSCDVYSLAIVLWEVLKQRKPYDDVEMQHVVIPFRVIQWPNEGGIRPEPLRDISTGLHNLITRAWAKDPTQRPTADVIRQTLLEEMNSENNIILSKYITAKQIINLTDSLLRN